MKVLASCDPIYYKEHSTAFINSCLDVGMQPVIRLAYNSTKEFYACNRFLVAEEYLEPAGVLITDVDCYFNKALPDIEEDVGIFLREYEKFPGMKVAAGILWLNNTEKARLFITRVREIITSQPLVWYADQLALYKAYNEYKNNTSFFIFDNTHMDWEFNDDSYMWTGKGNRKFHNTTYLKKKRHYESINPTT